jgi:hypothetical protein
MVSFELGLIHNQDEGTHHVISQTIRQKTRQSHHPASPQRQRAPRTPTATGVLDDSVFRNYGGKLELVGKWWSGQHKRIVDGMDGVLLLVVIGDGKLIVPVDFEVRRLNPKGPGRRCRTKLGWAQVMLDETLAALRRRGLNLPAPLGGPIVGSVTRS